MESIEILTQEIIDKLSELEEITNKIKSLPPVSHKSQAKIQFVGGVLGPIQEHKEGKRLENLINEPIVNGQSFYNLALFIIPEAADYLVERQLKIQQLVSKDDKHYYGLVIDIFNYIDKLTCAWYNYSPDMANESLNIGNQKNVALAPSVYNWTKESIKKLDLPPEVANHYNEYEKQQPKPSGCLGSFLMLLMLGSSCYGLFQLLN